MSAEEYLTGDMNGDGEIVSNDAIYLLRHILLPQKYPISQAADLNGDGKITTDDAISLLRHTIEPEVYPITCVHNIVQYEAKVPTCTEIGWDAYEACTRCDYSTYSEIEALGHSYENRKCTVCGKVDPNAYSEGLKFTSNGDGTCYVSGIGTCTDTDIVIPKVSPSGDKVTSIGSSAFYDCDNLTSVTIGDSVTSIGDDAFKYCDSLTSVTIGDSVTSIGDYAFDYCYKLVEVINKSGLNITKGSTSNGYVAYYALEVHKGDSKIVNNDGYLFYTYNGINYLLGYTGNDTELVLPESYNGQNYEIYKYAFHDCTNLTSVTIPDSVTSIGEWAFEYCYKLVEIINKSGLNITKGSTSNGYVAYYALEVHDGDSKIVNKDDYLFYTFDGVNYLLEYVGNDTELVLPENYNGENYEIYEFAFYDCDSLTSVTIPNSVTSIGFWTFNGCSGLTSVTFNDTSTWYRVYGGNYDNWQNMTGGTETSVTNSYENITYFTSKYIAYLWYKK